MAESTLVHMKLLDTSDCNFRYDFLNEVPRLRDLTGRMTIQPKHMLLRFTPDAEGSWYLDLLSVFGLPVIDGKVREFRRQDNILFSQPLDGEDHDALPPWLKEIAEHHVLLMNDGSPELRERQQEAARKAAREMFSLASEDMADEMADAIFTAIRRVG